jgi:hypothetical protein
MRIAFAFLIVGFGLFTASPPALAQEVRDNGAISGRQSALAVSPRFDSVDAPAMPYASKVQDDTFVRPSAPVADADRSSCLVNMACFCEGPMDVWGFCRGSSICKPNQGDFCAYWYDDPNRCTTMNEAECNVVH